MSRKVYIAGKLVSMETRQSRLFKKYEARPRKPKTMKVTSG